MIKNNDRCEITILHPENIERVQGKMPDNDTTEKLAGFFKLFADPTRTRLLFALSEQEMCVCDLSALLDMTQSAISHQLKALRLGGLVKSRRDGRVVYYSLDDDHVTTIFKQGLLHIAHL